MTASLAWFLQLDDMHIAAPPQIALSELLVVLVPCDYY